MDETEKEALEKAKHEQAAVIQARARSLRRMMIATGVLFAFAASLAVYLYIQNLPPPNGKYDAFARCIADTSTTFYGAWWCPHCQAQKSEFGDAAKYLPYVECSNSDTSEKQSCIDLGIAAYPTWYFPDGSSSTGENTLAYLAKKTGCQLPTSTGS